VKKLVILLGLAALLAGGYWYVSSPRHPVLSEKVLTFAPFTRGAMRDVVSATGILETRDIVLVGSEIPGVVHMLYGRVNDVVVEGMTLATLDDRRIRLKVDEADDNIRAAKAAIAQAEALKSAADIALKNQIDLESKGGFRADRDQAEAQVKAASAGLLIADAKLKAAETGHKEAQLAFDMIHVKVPVTTSHGKKREYLVLERKAFLGQMVGPQAGPMFTLAGDLAHMEAHAQVSEGDVNKVRKGLAALFTIGGFNEEDVEFRGVVREIRPLANNVKGAVFYDTVIELDNQKDPASGEWRLRPGMTVSIDIVRREHKDVWKIPSQALNFKMDDAYFTPAIRARLDDWKKRPDADQWITLWTWNQTNRSIWPLFVRILGTNAAGEPGLKDSEGNEVLEWESESPQHPPRLIIGAPPAKAPGMFDSPANFKVS
jgi:multidrug efflux pump subunit AcrA (membrane-fusion protein)